MKFIDSIAERLALQQEIPLGLAKRKVISSLVIAISSGICAVVLFIIYILNLVPIISSLPGLIVFLIIGVIASFTIVSILPILQSLTVPSEEEDFAYLVITAYATKLSSSKDIIKRFILNFGRILPNYAKIITYKPSPAIERLLLLIDFEGSSPTVVEKSLSKFETLLEKKIIEFRSFTELFNSIVVGLFITLPMLSLVTYLIGGSGMFEGSVALALILTLIMIIVFNLRTPKYFPRVMPYIHGLAVLVLCAAIGLAMAIVLKWEFWLSVGSTIILGGFIGYLVRRSEAKLVDEIMESLPRVLAALYDRVREVKSINIMRALADVLKTAPEGVKRLLNPFLDNVVIDVASRFRNYLPIAVILRALQDFSELGVSELAYKVLADGVSKIYDSYETYKATALTVWATLCFVLPGVLALVFSVVTQYSHFIPQVTGSPFTPTTTITLPPIDYLITCGLILVVLSGFAGGFIRYGRLAEALLWTAIATLIYIGGVVLLVKLGYIYKLIRF